MIIYYLYAQSKLYGLETIKVTARNVYAMLLGRNISQKDFVSKVGIVLSVYRHLNPLERFY